MKVKFVKLRKNAITPTKGSDKAAGFDLYANLDDFIKIEPHKTVLVPTGLAITPPEGYWGAIFARSGLACKQGLRPANCVGVCDEDYTGEYMVALYNDSDEPRCVGHGDRIAQLVFLPYIDVEFEEAASLDETKRGAGGFGSTGIN
jgi:dUTP pyrophosphatase